MGLIKAGLGSLNGVLADQWKEYFYCEAIPETVLAVRGKKRVSGRSSNTKGSENIISSGSVIAVADGQCMMIVEQGRIVELCAEPGEFTYDASTEPSLFAGGLNSESIHSVFQSIGKRFGFGGEAPKDQRVYYFNTKELFGNRYGTPQPVPFKTVDEDTGIALNIHIKCFGEYSYSITNPLLFYANVCGNFADEYTRDTLDSQLKSELLTQLQTAFSAVRRVDYTTLPSHTAEIARALNQALSEQWRDRRGIEIVSFGISSVKATEEDEKKLQELQVSAAYRDPTLAAGAIVGAQTQSMKDAANNPGGAALGFMNMNAAMSAGGMNAGNLYAMGQQTQQNVQPAQPSAPAAASSWTCSCGTVNTGKFCSECGSPRPAGPWTCSCGTVNTGKFCAECGRPRP